MESTLGQVDENCIDESVVSYEASAAADEDERKVDKFSDLLESEQILFDMELCNEVTVDSGYTKSRALKKGRKLKKIIKSDSVLRQEVCFCNLVNLKKF